MQFRVKKKGKARVTGKGACRKRLAQESKDAPPTRPGHAAVGTQARASPQAITPTANVPLLKGQPRRPLTVPLDVEHPHRRCEKPGRDHDANQQSPALALLIALLLPFVRALVPAPVAALGAVAGVVSLAADEIGVFLLPRGDGPPALGGLAAHHESELPRAAR